MAQEFVYEDFEDYELICRFHFVETEDGGRESPCFSNYRGQFFYHYNDAGTDWLARYIFSEEPVNPGGRVLAKVSLAGTIQDLAEERGMPVGRQVAIREGHRIVAIGVIEESEFDYFNFA